MNRISCISLFIGFFAVAGLLKAETRCTNADLRGDFSTQPQGILTLGPFAGPFSAAGVIRFDGQGRFEGVATSSFNGTVIFPFEATGSYAVTPDCLITTFEETLRIAFEGYVSKTRNEVYLFQPQDASITTNTLHRLHISSCTDSDLQDSWVVQASGSNIITGGRFAQIGRLEFDGAGHVAGTAGSSVNGRIVRSTLAGTYRVRKDCNFSARLTDENGVLSHLFGTLFDDGSQFIFIYSDDGKVIPGSAIQIASN